jgi:hypothetical protein
MNLRFEVLSVAVRMGRRLGREVLGDRQRDDEIRPGHRSREGRRFVTGEKGRSRESKSRQKGLTNSEVRSQKGEKGQGGEFRWKEVGRG